MKRNNSEELWDWHIETENPSVEKYLEEEDKKNFDKKIEIIQRREDEKQFEENIARCRQEIKELRNQANDEQETIFPKEKPGNNPVKFEKNPLIYIFLKYVAGIDPENPNFNGKGR
jgi:hypothetical protein